MQFSVASRKTGSLVDLQGLSSYKIILTPKFRPAELVEIPLLPRICNPLSNKTCVRLRIIGELFQRERQNTFIPIVEYNGAKSST